jgi:hypothetical protein
MPCVRTAGQIDAYAWLHVYSPPASQPTAGRRAWSRVRSLWSLPACVVPAATSWCIRPAVSRLACCSGRPRMHGLGGARRHACDPYDDPSVHRCHCFFIMVDLIETGWFHTMDAKEQGGWRRRAWCVPTWTCLICRI